MKCKSSHRILEDCPFKDWGKKRDTSGRRKDDQQNGWEIRGRKSCGIIHV
jgi:hypothetical protein